jgi:hypothetical protein
MKTGLVLWLQSGLKFIYSRYIQQRPVRVEAAHKYPQTMELKGGHHPFHFRNDQEVYYLSSEAGKHKLGEDEATTNGQLIPRLKIEL